MLWSHFSLPWCSFQGANSGIRLVSSGGPLGHVRTDVAALEAPTSWEPSGLSSASAAKVVPGSGLWEASYGEIRPQPWNLSFPAVQVRGGESPYRERQTVKMTEQ